MEGSSASEAGGGIRYLQNEGNRKNQPTKFVFHLIFLPTYSIGIVFA